jgi:two-component SAPR family response regulator
MKNIGDKIKMARTIFAIDDNPYFINTLINLLKKHGHNYKTFNHPDKMLKALSNFDKNILMILIDYQMPEINGINLAKQIRKNINFNAISMILLSQYKELPDIQKKQVTEELFLKVIFKGDIFTALPDLFREVFEE